MKNKHEEDNDMIIFFFFSCILYCIVQYIAFKACGAL